MLDLDFILYSPAFMPAMWILIGMAATFAIWAASESAGQDTNVQKPGAIAGAVLLGLLAVSMGGFAAFYPRTTNKSLFE